MLCLLLGGVLAAHSAGGKKARFTDCESGPETAEQGQAKGRRNELKSRHVPRSKVF